MPKELIIKRYNAIAQQPGVKALVYSNKILLCYFYIFMDRTSKDAAGNPVPREIKFPFRQFARQTNKYSPHQGKKETARRAGRTDTGSGRVYD